MALSTEKTPRTCSDNSVPYYRNHSLYSWRPRRRTFLLSTTKLQASQGFLVFRDAPGARWSLLLGPVDLRCAQQRRIPLLLLVAPVPLQLGCRPCKLFWVNSILGRPCLVSGTITAVFG